MPQPSANIVDAVSGAEVCPLCFDLYSAADACACVVCQVASCPGCSEVLDADGAERCFACRPLPVAARAAVVRGPELPPLSLPRPVRVTVAAPASAPAPALVGLPSLPFPLTTSPAGVRAIVRKPPGSVFIGLPGVAPALSQALRSEELSAAAARHTKLARRAQHKLLLLTRIVETLGLLALRAKRELAVRPPVYERAARRYLALALTRLASTRVWLELRAEPLVKLTAAKLTRFHLRAKPATVHPDPSRPIQL